MKIDGSMCFVLFCFFHCRQNGLDSVITLKKGRLEDVDIPVEKVSQQVFCTCKGKKKRPEIPLQSVSVMVNTFLHVNNKI